MDTLEKFVNSLLAGELKPYLKSEPVPESNDAPVKVSQIIKIIIMHNETVQLYMIL